MRSYRARLLRGGRRLLALHVVCVRGVIAALAQDGHLAQHGLVLHALKETTVPGHIRQAEVTGISEAPERPDVVHHALEHLARVEAGNHWVRIDEALYL